MKKTIWIIDDYLPMLDCMRIMLELHHYDVKITPDGSCLLNKNTKPDLLLIDYHIPGIDACNLVDQIRNKPEFHHIPIILMSGHKDVEQLSIRYGANDFIAKPFYFDELLRKVEVLLCDK